MLSTYWSQSRNSLLVYCPLCLSTNGWRMGKGIRSCTTFWFGKMDRPCKWKWIPYDWFMVSWLHSQQLVVWAVKKEVLRRPKPLPYAVRDACSSLASWCGGSCSPWSPPTTGRSIQACVSISPTSMCTCVRVRQSWPRVVVFIALDHWLQIFTPRDWTDCGYEKSIVFLFVIWRVECHGIFLFIITT